jgi:hypothetical protein
MTTPFKIELTKEQARTLHKILDWCYTKFPLEPTHEMLDTSSKLELIILHGCELHGIMRKGYKTEKQTTEWICPKCNPEKCAVYETKYKGIT